MWWTKPKNIFRNKGYQILSEIWPGDEVFRKSRQIITEKITKGCNILIKGGKKFNYVPENILCQDL
jgi:hypothetical protein